jgi:PAS domain S-box-containing protein
MTRATYTLLLVDDFAPDRELYRRCLLEDSSYAYRLLEANCAAAGLELCRTHAIDAILLDYELPDADGLAFIEALHAHSNGDSPPVVMITGKGDETVAVRAIKLGAEDYLVKRRLTPEQLQLTIHSAIENTQLRQQLKQSDDRFRVSIENMLDCFGIYSAIRDESGQIRDFRIDYLNAAALKSNQMTAADIGKGLCELLPAHHDTGLFAEYCRVVETGEPLCKEDWDYSDVFGTRALTRIYDVHANKLNDGFVASWRDVTARKHAEVSLQEANQQITTIWESMTDGYVTLDRDWRIVYANPVGTQVICQATQLKPEEFLGKTHQEVFPSTVGQTIEREYQRAMAEQVAVHFEMQYEPNGSWFEIHAYPSEEGLGIYFRDITVRKKTEETVLQQLAEIEAIYTSAPVGLGFVDTDLRFVRINEQLAEINGISVSEHFGRTLREVLPEMADQLEPLYRQVIESGEPILNLEVQGTNRAQPGVVRHWCLCYYPHKDTHDRVLGVNVMVQEITDRIRYEHDRKQADLALNEQTQLLQLIVNSVGDGLIMTNSQGEFVLFNQAAERIFGRLTNERPCEEWSQTYGLFLPDQQTLFPDHELPLYRAMQGEYATDVEVFVRRDPAAEGRWISISGFPVVDASQEITGGVITCRDITDRKCNEQRLRESEERLYLGVQVAGVALTRFDYASNTVTLSPEAAALYGIPADELVITRDRIHATFHPEDRAELEQIIAQVLDPAGGGWFARDHRVVWQDGEVRWLSVRKQVVFNRSHPVPYPDYAILAAIDVTDRKRIEEYSQQLAVQAEQQLRKIDGVVSAVPDFIYTFDLAGRFTYVNQPLLDLWQKTLDQAIGKNFVELEYPTELAERLQHQIQQVITTQQPLKDETPYTSTFGEQIYEYIFVPLFDANGDIEGVAGITRAITERKQAEAALCRSEERYRYLSSLIPQLVWIVSSDGIMLDVNERWTEVTGLSLEQAQIDGWQQIVHPEDVLTLSEAWQFAQQEGIQYQAEGRIRRADGVYRWHLHQAMPLKTEQGRIIKWFGTATDIHDMKQIEADRARLLVETEAARAEAEAANRSKDEFVAIAAHELRSPLNSVLGWAKLLQSCKLDEKITAKALDTICRNTQSQVQLVEDLLDISRMVKGTLEISLAPVKLGEVVESALELVRPMANAKQIQLETQLIATPHVLGDFNRLQQVVVNLLTNAIKFTPDQGRVTLQLESFESQVQLSIRDTGKGIAAEFLPRIFDRFQQGQKNTGSKDGLGLGLAIVKNLVELHNGTIRATSAGVGQGATFTVCLPILVPSADTIESDVNPADSIAIAGIRVLIVDDEVDQIDLLTVVLKDTGAEVKSVMTIADALQQLSLFKPDILVSDIAMPEGTGYELVQQMKSHPDGQIPAIALTAYASATYEERSLQAGFDRHLTKPLEAEDLIAAIAHLVRKNKPKA